MTFSISDELLRVTQLSEQEMRIEIAVMLFQQERLTLGQASELTGLYQYRFQNLLAGRGIGPHYELPVFEEDQKTLKRLKRL